MPVKSEVQRMPAGAPLSATAPEGVWIFPVPIAKARAATLTAALPELRADRVIDHRNQRSSDAGVDVELLAGGRMQDRSRAIPKQDLTIVSKLRPRAQQGRGKIVQTVP